MFCYIAIKNTQEKVDKYFTQQAYLTKGNSFALINFTVKNLLEDFCSISCCFLCMPLFYWVLHSFIKFEKRSTLCIIFGAILFFREGSNFSLVSRRDTLLSFSTSWSGINQSHNSVSASYTTTIVVFSKFFQISFSDVMKMQHILLYFPWFFVILQ